MVTIEDARVAVDDYVELHPDALARLRSAVPPRHCDLEEIDELARNGLARRVQERCTDAATLAIDGLIDAILTEHEPG